MTRSDFENFLKTAAMQVGAGGSAGFVEVCIMHPLDLVKTRLQLQSKIPTATVLRSSTGAAAAVVESVSNNSCR